MYTPVTKQVDFGVNNRFDVSSVNVCDEFGNNVLMKLLKVGRYDIVLKHMKNKEFDNNTISRARIKA